MADLSVGKAGDLYKWIYSNLSFVFGCDNDENGLMDKVDGACTRYLNEKRKRREIPRCLFINSSASVNIKEFEDPRVKKNEKAKQIINAIFGKGTHDIEKLGEGVYNQFGAIKNGADVVSNQFSTHYFFENHTTLHNYLRNVSEFCKVGGYFIGTCYDGNRVFNKLKKKEMGEGIAFIEDGKKMWEMKKLYNN